MENPDSSEFIYYDRSSGKKSRIHRVYTDLKIANNTKINHILIFLTDHYNSISLEIPLSEIKIGKDTWIILFYVKLCSWVLLNCKEFVLLTKNTKNTILQKVTGGNTPVLVLKRMLWHFLKHFSLKNISES